MVDWPNQRWEVLNDDDDGTRYTTDRCLALGISNCQILGGDPVLHERKWDKAWKLAFWRRVSKHCCMHLRKHKVVANKAKSKEINKKRFRKSSLNTRTMGQLKEMHKSKCTLCHLLYLSLPLFFSYFFLLLFHLSTPNFVQHGVPHPSNRRCWSTINIAFELNLNLIKTPY